jgi:hypothetical protein
MQVTLIDRIVSCVVGAAIGALIAFLIAWLLGVNSNTLGVGNVPVVIEHWVISGAIIFGVIGLVLGPVVGTIMGNVIAGIYAFETLDIPGWLVFALVVVVVGAVWWFVVH